MEKPITPNPTSPEVMARIGNLPDQDRLGALQKLAEYASCRATFLADGPVALDDINSMCDAYDELLALGLFDGGRSLREDARSWFDSHPEATPLAELN